jgi:hypothetical protein
MKSIEDWTRELAEANNAPKHKPGVSVTWEMLEYAGEVSVDVLGRVTARCQGCGDWTEVDCDPHQFDAAYHYCNKGGPSPCCP